MRAACFAELNASLREFPTRGEKSDFCGLKISLRPRFFRQSSRVISELISNFGNDTLIFIYLLLAHSLSEAKNFSIASLSSNSFILTPSTGSINHILPLFSSLRYAAPNFSP